MLRAQFDAIEKEIEFEISGVLEKAAELINRDVQRRRQAFWTDLQKSG